MNFDKLPPAVRNLLGKLDDLPEDRLRATETLLAVWSQWLRIESSSSTDEIERIILFSAFQAFNEYYKPPIPHADELFADIDTSDILIIRNVTDTYVRMLSVWLERNTAASTADASISYYRDRFNSRSKDFLNMYSAMLIIRMLNLCCVI